MRGVLSPATISIHPLFEEGPYLIERNPLTLTQKFLSFSSAFTKGRVFHKKCKDKSPYLATQFGEISIEEK